MITSEPTASAQPPVSDRRRIAEIIAVALTGAGKFIFMDHLQMKFEYVATACAYALAQIIAFLSLGIILFQRRDVG